MRTPEQLPDPWLLETEQLLRELDRCREMVLLIPVRDHATHFGVNIAVNAIWNLTETIRYLHRLRRERQWSFGLQSTPPVVRPALKKNTKRKFAA